MTLYEDRPVEHILFWVNDASKDYVATKPIHESQKQYQGEGEQRLRAQYQKCEGGSFFSIDCIKNYELTRELCSFGPSLVVLSPETIRDDIMSRLNKQIESYNSI